MLKLFTQREILPKEPSKIILILSQRQISLLLIACPSLIALQSWGKNMEKKNICLEEKMKIL